MRARCARRAGGTGSQRERRARTHARTHAHTHARARARTHACTHARTHAHTHTLLMADFLWLQIKTDDPIQDTMVTVCTSYLCYFVAGIHSEKYCLSCLHSTTRSLFVPAKYCSKGCRALTFSLLSRSRGGRRPRFRCAISPHHGRFYGGVRTYGNSHGARAAHVARRVDCHLLDL